MGDTARLHGPQSGLGLSDFVTIQPLEMAGRSVWRAWLEANHEAGQGVWLVCCKKANSSAGLTYDDALDEALCFGWIDGGMRPLDRAHFAVRFSPRRRDAIWSRRNKKRLALLEESGLLQPSGRAAVDAAQRSGSWHALDAVDALIIPADLEAALATHPPADQNFSRFSTSLKRQMLWWILSARRAPTRARRISEVALAAAQNRTPHAPGEPRKPTVHANHGS